MFDELDEVLGLSNMDLNFEAHVAGFDGECFDFCIYFGSSVTDEEACAVENAVHEFLEPYEIKDIYLGYVDITSEGDKVRIYLDLGNVDPGYEQTAISGILKSLNNVDGIDHVIINE